MVGEENTQRFYPVASPSPIVLCFLTLRRLAASHHRVLVTHPTKRQLDQSQRRFLECHEEEQVAIRVHDMALGRTCHQPLYNIEQGAE